MWLSIGLIIGVVIAGSALYVAMFQDDGAFFTPPNNVPLSVARELEGTWKTAFATKFYIKTDFSSVNLEDVGSENRTMTWVITVTSDENVVDVEVEFTSSNRQLIQGSGYTPDVSPMFLEGHISGTRLSLASGDRTIGEFSFTSVSIQGTWDDLWTMACSQEVYTATNGLTLTKQ